MRKALFCNGDPPPSSKQISIFRSLPLLTLLPFDKDAHVLVMHMTLLESLVQHNASIKRFCSLPIAANVARLTIHALFASSVFEESNGREYKTLDI